MLRVVHSNIEKEPVKKRVPMSKNKALVAIGVEQFRREMNEKILKNQSK